MGGDDAAPLRDQVRRRPRRCRAALRRRRLTAMTPTKSRTGLPKPSCSQHGLRGGLVAVSRRSGGFEQAAEVGAGVDQPAEGFHLARRPDRAHAGPRRGHRGRRRSGRQGRRPEAIVVAQTPGGVPYAVAAPERGRDWGADRPTADGAGPVAWGLVGGNTGGGGFMEECSLLKQAKVEGYGRQFAGTKCQQRVSHGRLIALWMGFGGGTTFGYVLAEGAVFQHGEGGGPRERTNAPRAKRISFLLRGAPWSSAFSVLKNRTVQPHGRREDVPIVRRERIELVDDDARWVSGMRGVFC